MGVWGFGGFLYLLGVFIVAMGNFLLSFISVRVQVHLIVVLQELLLNCGVSVVF